MTRAPTVFFLSLFLAGCLFADSSLSASNPATKLRLKDVAGDLRVATSTAWDGPNGIIKGPNVEQIRKAVLQHFNAIQPAVYPTWGGFWPSEKPPTLEDYHFWTKPLSAQAQWAEANGLEVLHHGLLAPNYYFPDWWKTTNYSAQELEIILKKYISSVVSVEHVDVWNLFNELFLGDGSYFPDGSGEWDNKWLGMGMEADASGLSGEAKVNKEHPKFIRIALEQAAAHTHGKLELREGTTFQNPQKIDALYQLVLHIQNSGTPLHAVGVQGHLDYNGDYDFEAFQANVAKFKRRGIEFYITELDVGLPKGEDPETIDWPYVESRQAEMYYEVVKAARGASVDWISFWGLTDAPKGAWRGGERALLLDFNYKPKPSYEAVFRALKEIQH